MQIELTPEFSQKVFEKVGKLQNQPFSLSEPQEQIQFCTGFIEYLEKEANMDFPMAAGLIRYICEQGADWMVKEGKMTEDMSKTASFRGTLEEMDELVLKLAFDVTALSPIHTIQNLWNDGSKKIQDFTQGLTGTKQLGEKIDQVSHSGEQMGQDFVNGAFNGIKNKFQEGWDWLKDPNHLQQIAGPLIGGVGGALLPSLWGGGGVQSAIGAVGGALAGSQFSDPNSWLHSQLKQEDASVHPKAVEAPKAAPVQKVETTGGVGQAATTY